MISYEVAMGLALVAVFLHAGSMSTSEIVAAQEDVWFGLILLPSFVIYMISMVGETNRAPFDLPEAEGELVGGFHTEYSVAEVRAVLPRRVHQHGDRLGARHHAVPRRLARAVLDRQDLGRANQGYWPFLWFMGKVIFFIFIFIWLRGTLPRLRYDQFMAFGWKGLIPFSLCGSWPSPPSGRGRSTVGSTAVPAGRTRRSPWSCPRGVLRR